MITVVIPSFIRPELQRCLESIKNQSIRADIVITQGDNPSQQRNRGAALAKSPYILFTDDDTYLKKDCLEVLYDTIREQNLDVVFPAIRGSFNTSERFVSAGAGIFCKREIITTGIRPVKWDHRIYTCEDLDWGWTMMEAGYSWAYNDKAVIYHPEPMRHHEWAGPNREASVNLLMKKHPKRYAHLKEHDSSVLELRA